MALQAVRLGEVGGRLHVAEGQQLAAQRVLQCEQPGAREVRVVGLDRRLDLRQRQRTVRRVVERLRLHAAEDRSAATFPAVAMRLLAHDVLVATAAVREIAQRLLCVPVGMKSAASKPSMAAILSCSAFTLGSVPKTSSPRGAVAIAARMQGVGWVTVSLRRSTGAFGMGSAQKVLEHGVAVLGEDGFGVELHASIRTSCAKPVWRTPMISPS
jgi:hypothetical protein